jgi:hypothetical protein
MQDATQSTVKSADRVLDLGREHHCAGFAAGAHVHAYALGKGVVELAALIEAKR